MYHSIKRIFIYLSILTISYSYTLPPGYHETLISLHYENTFITSHPTEPDTIFVVEKHGLIWTVKDGIRDSKPFLDISNKVSNYQERGLHTMAIDPRSIDTPTISFFVYYIPLTSNIPVLSHFSTSEGYADVNSEKIILEMDPILVDLFLRAYILIAKEHIYLFTSDASQSWNSRSLDSLYGKALRLNLDGSIPEDNPFYNQAEGKYRSIYSLGFRIPYTAAYSPSKDLIYVNNNGFLDFEEINLLEPGCDYGWPLVEGPLESSNADSAPSGGLYRDPLMSYKHGKDNDLHYCALGGGIFYEPKKPQFESEYIGKYFFSDRCASVIKYLDPETKKVNVFATGTLDPISFTVTPVGAFYYTHKNTLFKIEYTGDKAPRFSYQIGHNETKLETHTITFESRATGAMPLHYQWMKEGKNGYENVEGETKPIFTLKNLQMSQNGDRYRLHVFNEFGSIYGKIFEIIVLKNLHLTPVIKSPVNGAIYADAFDSIVLNGEAHDDNGPISVENFIWEVQFQHNIIFDRKYKYRPTHAIGVNNFEFKLNTFSVDPKTSYVVRLIVKDHREIYTSTSVEIHPRLVSFEILSDPPGLHILLDNVKTSTPHKFSCTSGLTRKFAAKNVVYNAVEYKFVSWSNGKTENEFDLLIDSSLEGKTLIAKFEILKKFNPGINFEFFEGAQLNSNSVPKHKGTVQNLDKLKLSTLDKVCNQPIETGIILRFHSFFWEKSHSNFTFIYGLSEPKCNIRLYLDQEYVPSSSKHTRFLAGIRNKLELIITCSESKSICSNSPEISFKYSEASKPNIHLQVPTSNFYEVNPSPCLPQFLLKIFPIPKEINFDEKNYVHQAIYTPQFQPVTFEIAKGTGRLGDVYDLEGTFFFTGKNETVIFKLNPTNNSVYCPSEDIEYEIKVFKPWKLGDPIKFEVFIQGPEKFVGLERDSDYINIAILVLAFIYVVILIKSSIFT